MKVELLEKLIDAGFTKDEIFELTRGQTEGGKAPDETRKPDTQGEPDVTDQTGNEKQPDVTDNPGNGNEPGNQDKPDDNPGSAFENRLAGIEKSITGLVKAVQAANLKNDMFNGSPDSLEDETDKIMMGIIRPEVKRKG